MERKARGLFVVIEGQDGTGKTTLAREVVAALGQMGVVALGTREPSGVFGQRIRDAAREGARLEPWEEMAHFCMARAQHWREVIEPALASGIVVVCDRWLYSTLVYNVPRIREACGPASGERAYAMARASGVTPDLCLCLLVSEATRAARMEARRAVLEAQGRPMDAFDALPDSRADYEIVCGGRECVQMEGGGMADNLARALHEIHSAAVNSDRLNAQGARDLLTVHGMREAARALAGVWAYPRPHKRHLAPEPDLAAWVSEADLGAPDLTQEPTQGRLDVDGPQPVQMRLDEVPLCGAGEAPAEG
jgi:dTMP kinase